MALVRVKTLLEQAKAEKTAILAFEALDYNTIVACIEGAEQARRPVIIMLQPTERRIMTFSSFVEVVSALAKRATVPVALHLDHCDDHDKLLHAVCEGFTSVMADGSHLSFEQNVAFVKSITEVTKIFGVDVEGQLGHVGSAELWKGERSEEDFTKPEEAALFAECGEIASLGIAVGNRHGAYALEPQLDMERLAALQKAVDLPLVLHGCSGVPDAQLKQAMALGICKLNFATGYLNLYEEAQERYYRKHYKKDTGIEKYSYLRGILSQYVADKLQLCSLVVEEIPPTAIPIAT